MFIEEKHRSGVMKLVRSIVVLIIVTSVFSCGRLKEKPLRLAVASNMQFAISALVDTFQAQTNIDCEVLLSSSGRIAAQIKNGAPIDVFISADQYYPAQVTTWGLAALKPYTYAFGRLVFWSKFQSTDFSSALKSCRQIAIPNPEIAPYGKAASAALENVNAQNGQKLDLIYGESVSQVNQFIATDVVDGAFTAVAVQYADKLSGHGQFYAIADSIYQPIAQDIVLLKSAGEDASAFYDFMRSDRAKRILTTFGYETHE